MTDTALADRAMLSKSDLARYIGFTTRTVDRMVDRGDLPRPRLSSSGVKRWLRSEVDECLQNWPEAKKAI